MLRYMLRHIMVYTLIKRSLWPIIMQEITQLWYKTPMAQLSYCFRIKARNARSL